MLRYQLRNTILTPAMAVAVLGQCAFMLVGLYPKANADMMYNLQQSMTLGYGWLFISIIFAYGTVFHSSRHPHTDWTAESHARYDTHIV